MKRCIAAILLVLSVAGRLSAAAAADHADAMIRLPSHGLADGVEIGAAEKKRPWKCCDTTWCSRSIPPACRCMDAVEQCDEACDRCEAAQSDPSKHVCIDRYRGWPGPSCTKPDVVPSGTGAVVSGPGAAAVVGQPGQAPQAPEISVGEKARPWKCCDHSLCTRSAPPTCRCHDKVRKCAKTCENCNKDETDSSRYVCGDSYFGWPGPRCTKV